MEKATLDFVHLSRDVEDGTYFQLPIDCTWGEYRLPEGFDLSDVDRGVKEGVGDEASYLKKYGLVWKDEGFRIKNGKPVWCPLRRKKKIGKRKEVPELVLSGFEPLWKMIDGKLEINKASFEDWNK